MAEIFVSHSSRDTAQVDFFSRLAAGTKVRLVFEEFERILSGAVTAAKVKKHIDDAKAVFILLSPAVQGIPHTRDWVVWEAGVAANKDLWVFEQFADQGRVNVTTPYLRHYVVFELNDSYFGYLRPVLDSYDDSHVLGTVLVATGIGALLGKGGGAAAGAAAGLVMSDRSNLRPRGLQVVCSSCSSSYNVHLPQGQTQFRCPVCNKGLALQSS